MKRSRKKYPTYNEARLMKVKQQDLNVADVLNSMGLYRYKFINYKEKLTI